MDPCVATDSLDTTHKAGDGEMAEAREKKERDWAREKAMRELLATTRGLLLHFPGSCRFNNSSSRDDDDWNTYVRKSGERTGLGRHVHS